jgi:hypothetical protein
MEYKFRLVGKTTGREVEFEATERTLKRKLALATDRLCRRGELLMTIHIFRGEKWYQLGRQGELYIFRNTSSPEYIWERAVYTAELMDGVLASIIEET